MIELIFVDYHGFLDLPPDQLETPVSLPKNAPDNTLNFNFGQGKLNNEKNERHSSMFHIADENLLLEVYL